MPIHAWGRVDSGLFHHFHHGWTTTLCNALNDGVLPSGFFAILEQRNAGSTGSTLSMESGREDLTDESEAKMYAFRADRIGVHSTSGKVVAVVEIVSPGNKGSQAGFRAFIKKSAELIRQDIHLLVVDLFPPGKRDPQGIHKAIWDEFDEVDMQLPPGKPLTVASYDAGGRTAYVNFAAVGDTLPDAPLFFQPERYVPAPLEHSYQTAWGHFPKELKGLLEGSPQSQGGVHHE